MKKNWKEYRFLFKELVKRDFQKRYKRTFLGILWSVLSPLLDFLVMKCVFTFLFGRSSPHYATYLFSGLMINGYFNEATNSGMFSLSSNAGIMTKISVPKYIFLLSKNVASLLNLAMTFIVYLAFVYFDGIEFTWRFFCLIYPVVMLVIFNIGMGLILSALFVFFKDIQYLYGVFLKLLMYVSAIFYQVERFPENVHKFFYINPIYDYITYFREITIEQKVPDLFLHVLCAAWAIFVLIIGIIVYKRNNYKFVFYF